MRSLKKRILSFVSAVAMVATVVPTTGLFASAEATTTEIFAKDAAIKSGGEKIGTSDMKTEEKGDGNTYTFANGNNTAFAIPFEVPELGDEDQVTVDVYGLGQSDSWACIWKNSDDFNKKDNEICDGIKVTNDTWGDLYKNKATFTLKASDFSNGAGTYYAGVKGDRWFNLLKIVVTIPQSTPAKPPVDLSTLGVTISAMSNDVNKGTVSPKGILETPNSAKLTYTVNDDNNFVGWYVRASDDNTSGLLLNKKAVLDVDAVSGYIAEYATEHPDKNLTIFATFAGWRNYRYEAEDYVSLVSETQYKYLNTEEEHDKYDDPTVVLEGNKGYTQGETATHTVYGSDNKFSDGHYAKAAGESSSDNYTLYKEYKVDTSTDATTDGYSWSKTYSDGWKQKVSNVSSDSDWSSKKDCCVTVNVEKNNSKVDIDVWSNGWINIYVDDQLMTNTDAEKQPGGSKTYSYDNISAGEHKIYFTSNAEWTDVSNVKVYSPKETSSGGDKVKYQHYYGDGDTFDAKSYSDLKIAPNYSNGKAVALTGPSNGLAIPFNLTEATTTDMTVELGYNFGTMPTEYMSNDQYDYTGNLWANIYYLGNNGNMGDFNQFKSCVKDKEGWKESTNAYYNLATGALKAMMPNLTNEQLGSYLPMYTGLSVDGEDEATYIDGSKVPQGDDNRSSDRSVTLKLPQGLPAGSYAITVATDQGNCDDKSESIGGQFKSNDASIKWHAGTAYYDYVQFRMIDDPSKPNAFVSGADISFTDSGVGNDGEDSKMKNTLRVTEFSDISFDENGIKFTPVAPEFLVNQGYEFTGWTLKVNNFPGKDGVADRVILNEILNGADPANYSATCAAISSYAFPAGTSIEFIANYKIENGSQTLTVENGTIYIPEGGRNNNNDGTEETENYTIAAKDKNVTLRRFANVKLVADEKEGETFSHWTVNGMIYSYNKEIFFSSVYNATFVANYKNNVTKPEATAYLDQTVAISGFSAADNTNQQKLTFLAEYSINDDSYNVKAKFDNAEFGLIYAATDEGLANMKSAKNSSTFSGSIARCGKMVVTNKENIIRNETFFGIGGLRLGRTYYAMSYVVYNGKVYYSDIISITPAADNNGTRLGTIVE